MRTVTVFTVLVAIVTSAGCGSNSVAPAARDAAQSGPGTLSLSGGDAGNVFVPTVDGKSCLVAPTGSPGLVCFGEDPTPYRTYLVPSDGGVGAPGQCPSLADFPPPPGEDQCGNQACGPIVPSAAAALQEQDASASSACCYLVYYACQG